MFFVRCLIYFTKIEIKLKLNSLTRHSSTLFVLNVKLRLQTLNIPGSQESTQV